MLVSPLQCESGRKRFNFQNLNQVIVMQRWTSAIVLWVAVVGSVCAAGEKAVERPLPTQFFSDKTVMLTHIDVTNITGDNIYKTLKAIVPAKYQEKMKLDQKKLQFA